MNVKYKMLCSSVTVLLASSSFAGTGLMHTSSRPVNLSAPFLAVSEKAALVNQLENFSNEMSLIGKVHVTPVDEISSLGIHAVKTQITLEGIPVHGAILSAHDGDLDGVTFSSTMPKVATPVLTPTISEKSALAIASLYSGNPLARAPELRLYQDSARTKLDLVWWVDFRSTDMGTPGTEVIINAHTGKLIGEVSKLHTANETEVYNANESGFVIQLLFEDSKSLGRELTKIESSRINNFRNFKAGDRSLNIEGLVSEPLLIGCNIIDLAAQKKYTDIPADYCLGTIKGETPVGKKACQLLSYETGAAIRINPEQCDLYSADGKVTGKEDASAARAQKNSREVLDYYRDQFGRRSYDGAGSVVKSVVKAGYKFSNAAWMGDLNFMIYGAGDGEEFGDFTSLVDVAGHEMTHGVVGSTAKLTLMDEPGALNEATADYFGLVISQTKNWVIGKGLYLKEPERALRSIIEPTIYKTKYKNSAGEIVEKANPDKYSDRYQIYGDEACGKTNDRCFVHMNSTIISHGYYLIDQALGRKKAQDLIFLTLTQYYGPDTNLREAGNLLRQACKKLYDDTTCTAVDKALTTVEL